MWRFRDSSANNEECVNVSFPYSAGSSIPPSYDPRSKINRCHLSGLKGADVKLRKLIWNYLEFFVEHKDYTNLSPFKLRPNRDFYAAENYQLIRKLMEPYSSAVVEGQAGDS